MKSVIFLGKRTAAGSPRAQWPGAELWGTTHSNQKYAKKKLGTVDDWSQWWDIHPIRATPFYRGIIEKRPETYRWYQTLPGPDKPNYRPLWLLEKDPTIPAGVVFNWRRCRDAFSIDGEPGGWFTCQVDWMFAHAILEGYQHIILHGHGVSRDPQHMAAHRGILYWIPLARERGIKVTIVAPSWYIAPTQLYGVECGGLGVRR